MDRFPNGNTLGEQLCSMLDCKRIMETVHLFASLSRQSGTEDGEKAAAHIVSEMQRAGVCVSADRIACLASIPEETEIRLDGDVQEVIPAYTECWSGISDFVRGSLVYDELGEEQQLTGRQERDRVHGVAGKIVLTYSFDPCFYRRCKNAGALGLILIRPRDIGDPMLLGTTNVWGVPIPETLELLDCLPTLVVTARNGARLRAQLEKDPALCVSFSARANNGRFEFTQPTAFIPGNAGDCGKNYVLVAAHYDGWFRSVVDNAMAVGFTMELARCLQKLQSQLRRGVRFLWLGGHENVPYAGSTTYVDSNFEDLKKHCVAYINIDVIGGAFDPESLFINTTRMEGPDFADGLAEEIIGKRPEMYMPMVRAADQSFWGVEVPLCLMANGGDPGWWYHTAADTEANIDMNILQRDMRFYTQLILRIANGAQLPVDMPCFLREAEHFLKETQLASSEEFDFSPMFRALHDTQKKVAELVETLDKRPEKNRDAIYMTIAGELARICYTDADNFSYNLMGSDMETHPNGGVSFVKGVSWETEYPEDYLCITTKFVRLRNRYVYELEKLCERIEFLLQRELA